MKILDRYILSRFIFNFISSFLIIMVIFIFQTIWLYVDELVGRGLSFLVVIKFIALMLPHSANSSSYGGTFFYHDLRCLWGEL